MNDMAGINRSRLSMDLEAALPELSKAVLSQPVDRTGVQKVIIRPVLLKDGLKFQTESFRDNKAYHENLDAEELMKMFNSELDGRFRQALVITAEASAQYCMRRDGGYKRTGGGAAAPGSAAAPENHNRKKEYILPEGEAVPALVDLGVFTQDYKIVRSKYDKYKQINRFIELIDQQFSQSGRKNITILDFGCGKSYLTFIIYYYFSVKKGMDVKIIGYDIKADVVENCRRIAEKYGYSGLSFVEADVSRDKLFDEKIDMVVTLHACNTATDYALNYAIRHGAEYIFSVPCCQHEINSSIKKGGELDVFMSHGIRKERMSALLTDAIRADILEDMGYSVDMIEFVDFEHSPKNIMIRARKDGRKSRQGRERARKLAERYGFTQTLLELTEEI